MLKAKCEIACGYIMLGEADRMFTSTPNLLVCGLLLDMLRKIKDMAGNWRESFKMVY